MNAFIFERAVLPVIIASVIISASAWAEEVAPEYLKLSPVVVTGVSPASPLTVVTDPGIPRQPIPASDAADYLQSIPGFSRISGGGTNGDPVLRGMFGSRLKLLSNGGELLGACPSRMDTPASYIAPDNFDRLTVIKGPQSVIWGPGASAGTVLFERLPEDFAELGSRLDASFTVGSNARRDTNLDGAIGSHEGYLRLSANRSASSDYDDGNGDKVPSKWYKWNTDLALGWTPNDDTLVELTVGRGDGEARYAGRGMDGSKFLRESLGLRIERDVAFGSLKKWQAQWYYNYVDHVMDNFSLRQPDPNASMMMRNPMATNVDRRTYGVRLSAEWAWESVKFTSGFDAQRNEHRKRSSSYTMMSGLALHDQFPWQTDAVFHQYGAFAEATIDFEESSRWVAGLRLDRVGVRDERTELSRMGAGVWANPTNGKTRADTLPSSFLRYEQDLLDESLTWYAGIGHSQRFPDYWEFFSASIAAPGFSQAFETVRPERTTQFDIGFQYQGEQWGSWMSAYAGHVKDYLLFRYVNAMGGMSASSVSNVDAIVMGAELGAARSFADYWNVEGSLAWSWGENHTDGTPLAQMPPLDAKFTLGYQRESWSVGALWRVVVAQTRTAKGQGNVVGRDLDDSAGFGVLSLSGAYRFSDRLSASIGVDNILDKTYSEHLNLAGNAGFGFPAEPMRINEPGRAIWVRVDLGF